MAGTDVDWGDPDLGLFSISVAAELAGIRRVLVLQAETRRLQAEVDRLRER